MTLVGFEQLANGIDIDGMKKTTGEVGLGRRNRGSFGQKMVLVSLMQESGVWKEIWAEGTCVGVIGM